MLPQAQPRLGLASSRDLGPQMSAGASAAQPCRDIGLGRRLQTGTQDALHWGVGLGPELGPELSPGEGGTLGECLAPRVHYEAAGVVSSSAGTL